MRQVLRSLAELIAVDPGSAPDRGGWAAQAFWEFIQILNAQDLGIVFVDLLIRRPFEDVPLAGFACLNPEAKDLYVSEVLKKLIPDGHQIGLHEEFLQGRLTEGTKKGDWLRWSQSQETTSELPVVPTPLNVYAIDILTDVFDGVQSALDEWTNTRSPRSISEDWEFMCQHIRAWDKQSSDLEVCGIPITIPGRAGERGGTFENIGLLFFGFNAAGKGESQRLNIIRSISGQTHTFALRTYTVSAKYIQELRQYQRLLESLQHPLNAITNSFNRLQSEAQEMRAILNDPEEALFSSHALIAPIYQKGVELKVSDYLTLLPEHDYHLENDDKSSRTLRLAYTYSISSILGLSDRLRSAQTVDALEEMAASAITEVRLRAARSSTLAALEALLTIKVGGGSAATLENTILWRQQESDGKGPKNHERRLVLLKALFYTPFKDFSGTWPIAPIVLGSFEAERIKDLLVTSATVIDRTSYLPSIGGDPTAWSMSSARTPIPLHGLLTFLLRLRRYLKHSKGGDYIRCIRIAADGPPMDNAELVQLTIDLVSDKFFDETLDGRKRSDISIDTGSLCACIEATFKFGSGGEGYGDFYGIFQGLLRHCQSTGYGFSSIPMGAWENVTTSVVRSVPDVQGVVPLLVLGKKMNLSGAKSSWSHLFLVSEVRSTGASGTSIALTWLKQTVADFDNSGLDENRSSQTGSREAAGRIAELFAEVRSRAESCADCISIGLPKGAGNVSPGSGEQSFNSTDEQIRNAVAALSVQDRGPKEKWSIGIYDHTGSHTMVSGWLSCLNNTWNARIPKLSGFSSITLDAFTVNLELPGDLSQLSALILHLPHEADRIKGVANKLRELENIHRIPIVIVSAKGGLNFAKERAEVLRECGFQKGLTMAAFTKPEPAAENLEISGFLEFIRKAMTRNSV